MQVLFSFAVAAGTLVAGSVVPENVAGQIQHNVVGVISSEQAQVAQSPAEIIQPEKIHEKRTSGIAPSEAAPQVGVQPVEHIGGEEPHSGLSGQEHAVPVLKTLSPSGVTGLSGETHGAIAGGVGLASQGLAPSSGAAEKFADPLGAQQPSLIL